MNERIETRLTQVTMIEPFLQKVVQFLFWAYTILLISWFISIICVFLGYSNQISLIKVCFYRFLVIFSEIKQSVSVFMFF